MRAAAFLPLFFVSLAIAQTTQPATKDEHAVGFIEAKEIRESSGIVESRKYPGVFWTHNDSGNTPQIFAIDRSGKLIGAFTVGIANRDWEDIATDDDGHVYIAETGNNLRAARQVAVYQLTEPDPRSTNARLPVKTAYQLRFPKEPVDIESLFIWKKHGYLISKHRNGTPASLFRFPLDTTAAYSVLEYVTDLPIRMPCTAADISQDGKFVVVMTVTGPYLFQIDGDLANIAKAPLLQVAHFDPTMEGACFVKEGVLATNERRLIYLFPFEAFKP